MERNKKNKKIIFKYKNFRKNKSASRTVKREKQAFLD